MMRTLFSEVQGYLEQLKLENQKKKKNELSWKIEKHSDTTNKQSAPNIKMCKLPKHAALCKSHVTSQKERNQIKKIKYCIIPTPMKFSKTQN